MSSDPVPATSGRGTWGLVDVSPAPIPGVPASVAALIDEAADRFGSVLALADRRTRFTYDELRQAVDQAADTLERSGVRPLDRVAMSLPNTVDVAIGFLAAMRLGAVWVGVNTSLAPPEKQFLIADSGACTLVTTAPIAESLSSSALDFTVVTVDIEAPGSWWADGRPVPRSASHVDPNAPAAIAYTSGTTGRPKGVVHSQHNIMLPAAVVTVDEPAALVQGVMLPLTILNLQVLATVQSMLSGGLLVPIDRADAAGVASWIAEFRVQRMYSPPTTAYDLLSRPDIDAADIATLTHFGVGGSKCPDGLRDRYRERFGRDFAFGYGLTEAPTSVTADPPGVSSSPIGSSGRTRDHVEVTIRDAAGVVVDDGAEGEICVGARTDGAFAGCYSTMLGYWNDPERTAKALRDGVLHTGDVGRIDEDGCLWVLDRRSELIIRGGANVYPAEVERVIEALPGVAEVAVVARNDDRLGEVVVAMIARAGDDAAGAVDRRRLSDACHAELARYKVPTEWFVVEHFPRNAMGKVQKPLLRAWLERGEWPEGLTEPAPLP